jgi:hypothetical protein
MLDFENIAAFIEHAPDYIPSIFIDVDDTLVFGYASKPNQKLCDTIKQLKITFGDKICIVVWSQGGAGYAKEAVEHCKISEYVDHCLAKPLYIIDDMEKQFGGGITQFVLPPEFGGENK